MSNFKHAMNSSTQHYGTWLDCAIDEWGVGFDSGIPDLAAVAGFRFVGRWNIGWCELVIDWHGLSCPRDDLEAHRSCREKKIEVAKGKLTEKFAESDR